MGHKVLDIEPKLYQNRPIIYQNRIMNGRKMDEKWTKNRTKIETKLDQKWTKSLLKCVKNNSQINQKDRKMDQKWIRKGIK